MSKYIVLRLVVIILLLPGVATFSNAQDSVKKTNTIKKPVTKTAISKPVTPPVNPKTGKPYTRYGYGSYAKTYRAAHIADSIKKASALKTAAPPDVTQAVVPPVTPPVSVDKSLNGQYQYLLTKVYHYQQPFVDALWKNFMDTLKSTRGQLKSAQEKLSQQNKTISGLQNDVSSKVETLSTTTSRADSISMFGIWMAKTTYNLIMWGLLIIIGIVAGVVIAQSGGYRREAAYRTKLYTELEEEYKTYKLKANEKEKKLARELQTERNKVDELMGRG